MSTVYSSIKRGGLAIPRSATQKYPVTPDPGGVSLQIAEYTAAALATGSTINMCTVQAPACYRIREVNHAALGAGTSLTAGRAGATAEQLASVSTVAAGVAPANDGFWRDITADEDVILTTVGTMTGRIQAVVEILPGNRAAYQ